MGRLQSFDYNWMDLYFNIFHLCKYDCLPQSEATDYILNQLLTRSPGGLQMQDYMMSLDVATQQL